MGNGRGMAIIHYPPSSPYRVLDCLIGGAPYTWAYHPGLTI